MSLILDALNKADHERNKEQAPNLNSMHDDPYESYHRKDQKQKLLVLGLIICIVLIVALGFYLVFGKSSTSQTQSSEQLPGVAQQPATPINTSTTTPNNGAVNPQPGRLVPAANATAPNPAASGARTRPTTVSGVDTQSNQPPANQAQKKYEEMRKKMIAAQYESVNPAASEQTAPANQEQPELQAREVTPERQLSSAPNQQQVANIYKNQVAETPQPQPVLQTPVPTIAPVETPPPSRNLLAGHPDIGAVHDLPFSMQKQLPTIMYREHNYYAQPPNVLLNNKTITKGQSVEPNLYLEEILKDGVIMRYQDKKFKMPRLNSWVNM